MKIEFLVLLFVVTTLKKIVGQSEYDIVKTPCSTNGTLLNYNIYSDNIAQFFSPNYPKNLIINETTSFCQARFYTIVQNYRIWMALYNGYTQSYNVFDDNNHQFGRDYFDSNDAIASFSSKTESLTYELDTFTNASYDWTAFQGVVIAYDPSTVQCPFSGQSINFTNVENTLIIPIASDFGSKHSNTKCQWNFSTYFGQYLKVVIKKLIVNRHVAFELQQFGKTIKRFDKNITDTEVYYFTSDAGSFTLYYNDTNDASVGTHFSALISDVNVPSSSTTEQCSSSSMADENKIMVYNLDYETGYKANQNCKYSIAMKEKQEISVSIEIFHIEKNVDTLFLIHGAKKYALTPDGMYSLQLTAAANNSLIVFNADSSVQQAGFEVALKTLDCSCPTQQIVVPCDLEIRFGPLNGGDVNYCDDMNCSYQISKNTTCSDNGYQLSLNALIRENLDYFNIYINGILHETLKESTEYIRYFTSDTNITVEFLSGSNHAIKTGNFWEITMLSQELPTVTPTMLTEAMPTFAVELFSSNHDRIFSVCSPNTDILELIVASDRTNLQNYILYDGSDFGNFVGNLDTPLIFQNSSNFGQIISKSNCFTIQKTAEGSLIAGIFLFRMKNAQSKNCEDKNNVMLLSSYNANFANTAKYTGECEMIILSTEKFPFPFYIDSMNGTSADIFTLKSTLNQNLLAEINSTDFLLWKNLQLYTPALSITLPPSTTFSMNALNENFDIYVDSDIQRGIMASPSYSVTGDTIVSGNGDPLYTIITSDSSNYITAEFMMYSIKGDERLIITSDFYNYNFNLTYNGEIILINGTQFQLFNYEMNFSNDSFLITYLLYRNSFPISTTESFPTTPTVKYTSSTRKPPPSRFPFSSPGNPKPPTTTTPKAPLTHVHNVGISISLSLLFIFAGTCFFMQIFKLF